MIAGRLRHRVQLQKPTASRDSTGAEILSFSTDSTVWAEIEPLQGREGFTDAQKVSAEVTHRIRMRYNASVGPTWRVLYADPKKSASRYFHVEAVTTPFEVREETRLLCRELPGGEMT